MTSRARKAIAIACLGVLVLVFIAYQLWMRLGKDAGHWWADPRRGAQEGTEFGMNSDQHGCLDKAFKRVREHPGLSASIGNNNFLDACLKTARPTADFCDPVPVDGGINIFATEDWRNTYCLHAGIDNPVCAHMLIVLVVHCQNEASQTH